MGSEISFAYLESGEQRPTAEALIVRETEAQTADGPALLALDAQDQRHLLIPHPMRIRRRNEGSLEYSSRRLGDSPRTYLDLTSTEPHLKAVFSSFVDHVLSQLSPDGSALVTVRKSVDEWKQLFRPGRGLSTEEATGLIGELEVLEHFARIDPTLAWETWKGPRGGVHDFMASQADLEVKCTSALDGGGLVIHGLDQLDPQDRPLYLTVHRVRENPSAPPLDARLDELVRLGIPKQDLLETVSKLGHTYSSNRPADEHRFRITHTRCWRVGNDFPGLRRSRLDPSLLHGVSRIRYTLAIESLPASAETIPLDEIIRRMAP